MWFKRHTGRRPGRRSLSVECAAVSGIAWDIERELSGYLFTITDINIALGLMESKSPTLSGVRAKMERCALAEKGQFKISFLSGSEQTL